MTSPMARSAAATLLSGGIIKPQTEKIVATYLDEAFQPLDTARQAFFEALEFDQASFPLREEVLQRRWLASAIYRKLTRGEA